MTPGGIGGGWVFVGVEREVAGDERCKKILSHSFWFPWVLVLAHCQQIKGERRQIAHNVYRCLVFAAFLFLKILLVDAGHGWCFLSKIYKFVL